jgi:hypothetical protein
MDMLTDIALLEVGAATKWVPVVKGNDIGSPVTALARHLPHAKLILLNLGSCCYDQSSFFSRVHLNSPSSIHLIYAYNSTHCVCLSIHLAKIFSLNPIDNSIRCVLLYPGLDNLNAVQAIIAQLEEKGWTIVAIADSDELKAHRNTVGMWKAGTRYPRPDKPVLDALNRLLKRNRIPKKKRYNRH